MTAVFLTGKWLRLVMLNFPIEPEQLAQRTPTGTEIDTFNGTTYVSLVAFLFQDTKVRGLSVPFHRNFEEINLRFYVRFRTPEGWRRGVVFVREVVPRWSIALVARWLYNEKYQAHPTRSTLMDPTSETEGTAEYSWRHQRQWLTVGARFGGEPSLPKQGSEEEFITEHYWGYSSQRDGGTVEYQVEHPQWKVWKAREVTLSDGMAEFYGAEFASALAAGPSSAFVAEGSTISVHKGTRIDERRMT